MGNVAVVKCPQCGLGNTMYLGHAGKCGRCGVPLTAPGAEPSDPSAVEQVGPRPPASSSSLITPLAGSRFRALSTLGRLAVIGFGWVVFIDALQAAVFWQRAGLLAKIEAGEPVSHADALANDRLVNGLSIGWLVAFVVAAVVFIWWFRRAYGNLPALGAPQKYRAGWAIGAWFVPILNLFRPWKMTEEIWRGSSPDRADAFDEEIPRPVRGWFFLLIGAGALTRAAGATETAEPAFGGGIAGPQRHLRPLRYLDDPESLRTPGAEACSDFAVHLTETRAPSPRGNYLGGRAGGLQRTPR